MTDIRRLFLVFIGLSIFTSCKNSNEFIPTDHDLELLAKAEQNGLQANQGFIKCRNYLHGWLQYRDPKTGLIPRNIEQSKDFWNAKDAAADNYPFMVLTSYFVDQNLFESDMMDMLNTEKSLTSRIRSLPDTYSFSKERFLNEEAIKEEIVFGASEYIKDGLLPLTEWLGESPWSERMLEMLYDLQEEVDVAGAVSSQGFGRAPREEVNGELLQVLSRIYWMTDDEKFLEWALKIGDFYLLGDHHPTQDLDYLRLRDHGCELVSGLCELYITCHYARANKKNEYQEPLYEMLNRILEVGRNEDGFFYDAINPQTGEVLEERIADTWGYTLNGFYGVYLIDGVEKYKEAVLKVFSNLHKYKNHNWEGNADGYADAIESALNLYNRIPDPQVADWIDSEIKVMWGMQRDDGIIEGWHGDGNFARTTIMYNLWKSKGLYIHPWREDLHLGAETKGDTLYIQIHANKAWSGKLYFDEARHQTNMHLPMDWPRINQFPEWFVNDPVTRYQMIEINSKTQESITGEELKSGFEIAVDGNKQLILIKTPA